MNPEKHSHPIEYGRATLGLVAGCTAGVLLMAIGIWAMLEQFTGLLVWLATLVIVGPAVVFFSAIIHSTYLERVERESYGAVYQDEENPGTMGSAH